MPKRSESTRIARELGQEMKDAQRVKGDREPPFMHESYADSEYRQHIRGLSKADQEAELQRLSPEELRRLFPPEKVF